MPAIRVENLFKEYVIGGRRERHRTVREALAGGLKSPLRRIRRREGDPGRRERFLALNDVSFEVARGEAVAIIGPNGAGKSTLLKILARITEPTAGRAELSGRVSSLLEVGTGFHPDLTGRENIFLNGVILGMSRAEIRAKFDEIVAFSEIERFLDTPVKRYSSGMYVRLAFAVAAHLEPEILVVDEVLAVGDASFQKRCLGKMEEAGKEGRTVLFVSHNMGAVRNLCDRAVWLGDGRVRLIGDAGEVVDTYLQQTLGARSAADIPAVIRALPPDPDFRLEGIDIRQKGRPCRVILNGLPVEIEIRYAVLRRTRGLRVYFDLCDGEDTILFRSFHDEDNDGIPVMEPGEYVSRTTIPPDLLGPVMYEIRVRAGIHNRRSCLPASGLRIPIEVEKTGCYNRAYVADTFRGKLGLSLKWRTASRAEDDDMRTT